MKKIHKILIAVVTVIALFFITAKLTHAALTPVSWIRDTVAGFVRPGILTDTLRIPSLTSCDTIDTDADGDFTCGTDGGGSGSSDGSAGAIQYSDGAGGFIGSFVDNLFYDDATDILYLLDDTTTYFKGGSYTTGFNFGANNITASTIRTYEGPNEDGTLALTDGTGTTGNCVEFLTITTISDSGAPCGGAGIPTQITVADTTDATTFVGLFESATGDLAPKTDGGILYDASNGTLSSTIFNTPTLTLTGTGTLNGLDAIDATTETTLEGDLELDSLQGNLGVSHLNSGTSASSSTFWRGDGTWDTPNFVPYTGATNDVSIGNNLFNTTGGLRIGSGASPVFYSDSGYTTPLGSLNFASNGVFNLDSGSGLHGAQFDFSGVTGTRTYTLPDVAGATIAVTSDIPTDADASETDTGTSTTKYVSPDGLAGSYAGTKNTSVYAIAVGTTVTTGDGKAYFVIPAELNGMNLVDVQANVTTTSSSGDPNIDIARGRQSSATTAHTFVDVLSTNITIDSTEYDSKDDATQRAIDSANDDVATGDLYRIDVDTAGTGTAGLLVRFSFRLP